MMNIFSNVKILDLTKVLSGPYSTKILADYGANVVKIESPNSLDDSRNFPPKKNYTSAYYEMLNYHKSKMFLDLKNSSDLDKFYQLVKSADIVVENMTPQTKYDLKINYKILQKINPKIIFASLSGKGQSFQNKYYDILAQAESGLLSLTGSKKSMVKIGPAVVDTFSGLMLAFGIASALYYRENTQKGQYLDVTMFGSALHLLENALPFTSINGTNPERSGNLDNTISPFGIFKVGDGYIAIAAGNEAQWQQLQSFLLSKVKFNIKSFDSNEKRLIKKNQLKKIIESVFYNFTREELLAELQKYEIPVAKVNEIDELLADNSLFQSNRLQKVSNGDVGDFVIAGKPINFFSRFN